MFGSLKDIKPCAELMCYKLKIEYKDKQGINLQDFSWLSEEERENKENDWRIKSFVGLVRILSHLIHLLHFIHEKTETQENSASDSRSCI